MSFRQSLPVLMAMFLFGTGAAPAQTVAAAKTDAGLNVYQYAIDNPVGDSRLSLAPTLGETVPQAISLVPLAGDAAYAYFYYNGRPVIVDVTTRSVVRVGQ